MGPGDEKRELRLGLSGDRLVFPEGRPFCLVCGRRPLGTRVVHARDPEFAERQTRDVNTLLEFVHPILGRLNTARLVAFEFEAPLCWRHLGRGMGPAAAAIAVYLLFVGLLALLVLKSAEPGGYVKLGLVGAAILAGFLFVRRGKGRPVIPCVAVRETRERVVLVYETEAPRPR